MAKEAVKQVAEKVEILTTEDKVVEKTRAFFSSNQKIISIVAVVVVVLLAGYFGYRTYVLEPNEAKADEAIWKAQSLYKIDSFRLALNGDGTATNPGFLKVISRYKGTKAASLAQFYAGSSYLKLGEFNNAIKYLEDFSTSVPELKLRTTGLLGDAYSELGKNEKAAEYYRKAAGIFEKDELNTSEYLYRLGQLYDKMGKPKDAIEAFRELKDKFPQSFRATEAEKYLARLGEVK